MHANLCIIAVLCFVIVDGATPQQPASNSNGFGSHPHARQKPVMSGGKLRQSEPLNIAKCTFTTPSNSTLKGTLTLAQNGGELKITGTLTGLTSGDHGIHVHETGDFSDGCTSALSHFNPSKKAHGSPADTERHVGDFGNIVVGGGGTVAVNIVDKVASLTGQDSIIGRSIVVHTMADDLGKGNFADSKTTGHAGARAGCCVIGYAKLEN